jgi:hypothetical protein
MLSIGSSSVQSAAHVLRHVQRTHGRGGTERAAVDDRSTAALGPDSRDLLLPSMAPPRCRDIGQTAPPGGPDERRMTRADQAEGTGISAR